MSESEKQHPGIFLRDSVLRPRKITVSAAAKLLGVGRPALSTFVNGRSSVSSDMAARAEVAFGVPAKKLLEMQVVFDAAAALSGSAAASAVRYVAPLVEIRAREIEEWANRNVHARSRLSVLLRTLVHSTAAGATRVDFPANDDAQRPGWDGQVVLEAATPWVPRGSSGWEFGTNADPKSKADADFESRVSGLSATERAGLTFVFVTPRHWPGKSQWANAKNALGHWKEVRAYDSSDLEQWIEQSLPAQTWFSNETSRPSTGVRSLDRCWKDWARVTKPPLHASLFDSAIASASRNVKAALARQPGDPIVIAADSAEEGLAFVSTLFGPAGGPELEAARDRVLVFDSPGVLPRLAQGNNGFIVVTTSRAVERECGPYSASLHAILIYTRNSSAAQPTVVLEPLGSEAFEKSLSLMGFDRDNISRLADESGRSLTVLRRRLAVHPAVKTPAWSEDHRTARSLVAFAFVGAWNSTNKTDQAVLEMLAGEASYEVLEKEVQRIVALDDSPMWSAGTARGVVSKHDCLYAVFGSITARDLERFFEVAKIVLGEDDPRLDLPDSERWTATLLGKTRELSGSARRGVAETLVLLAVHGNTLFRGRIGFDCEVAAARLVHDLLSPLTGRNLEAHDSDLTSYAEAAPDTFLEVLEDDLRKPQPEVNTVLRSVGSGFFSACPRTGLLWALEGLAWHPRTFPRTALALAKLAEVRIDDNWVNKPIRSLLMIFDARMPQTAADHTARRNVLRMIASKHPGVAWQICVAQLKERHWIGHYSHKPRWRNDGFGFGEPHRSWEPIRAFLIELVDLALEWPETYSVEMICDLVQCVQGLPIDLQDRVWKIVLSWGASQASDRDIAVLTSEIRRTLFSRRGPSIQDPDYEKWSLMTAAAKAVLAELTPKDVVNRHEWLFREQWIELSSLDVDIDVESDDFATRDGKVSALRAIALREVLDSRGVAGLVDLAGRGKAAGVVGWVAARAVLSTDELLHFVVEVFGLGDEPDQAVRRQLVSGAFSALTSPEAVSRVLAEARDRIPRDRIVDLAILAPFRRAVWEWIDSQEPEVSSSYWSSVVPSAMHAEADEIHEAMQRLLDSDRPRAAFSCLRWRTKGCDANLLSRTLTAIARGGKDKTGEYLLDPHDVEEAFAVVGESSNLTLDQKAFLEFAFLEILTNRATTRSGDSLPSLQKYIEAHPEFFVQAVVWAFKRSDDGIDPPEMLPDTEDRQLFAERGYKLLSSLRFVPGRGQSGDVEPDRLANWIAAVREGCERMGRAAVGDICLGEMLSAVPAGADGVWPGEPVRSLIERVHSKELMRGLITGRYNSRGVVWRGEGGDQERTISSQYQEWSEILGITHPFVASDLLGALAASYRREADREDEEAQVRRRLR